MRTKYAKPAGMGMRWNKTTVETPDGQTLTVIVEKTGKRWMLTVVEWQERTYYRTMRAAQAVVEELREGTNCPLAW